jgi:hypothetical protein
MELTIKTMGSSFTGSFSRNKEIATVNNKAMEAP